MFYFVVLVWDKSKCQVLSSVCPSVFLPLEVLLSVIGFSLTERKAQSGFVLSKHPVNMCDSIYFVHSRDRGMTAQLVPGRDDGVTLALKTLVLNFCFCSVCVFFCCCLFSFCH